MVAPKLNSLVTTERILLAKLAECQWKEKGSIPDLSRRQAGIMKRDKIRYF